MDDEVTASGSKVSTVAVVGLVLGLLWLGGVGSLLAVTFGIIGVVETGSPRRHGRPLAVAAVVLGVVGIVATLVALLLAAAPDRTERPTTSTRPGATTTTIGPRPIQAADQATCDAEIQLLEFGAQTYEALNGRYPTTLAELATSGVHVDQITLYRIDPSTGGTTFKLLPTAAGKANGCAPR